MLAKNPTGRMSNINVIKSHQYFEGFSFEDLISFHLDPPYLPRVPDSSHQKPVPFKNQMEKDVVEFTINSEEDIPEIMHAEFEKWWDEF